MSEITKESKKINFFWRFKNLRFNKNKIKIFKNPFKLDDSSSSNQMECATKLNKILNRKSSRDLNDDFYINNKLYNQKINKLIENLKSDINSFDEIVLKENYKIINDIHHRLISLNHSLINSHNINNCVVPELKQITSLSFYWPNIDRFKAEELLRNKPEGTFLLRNSSHKNFLFSVSFSRFSRALHARIEKENGQYSFDSSDPNSQKFNSITELFENYKANMQILNFEPSLIQPLNNPNVKSLKQLSQFTILSTVNYHHLNNLPVPQVLKESLKSFNFCSSNLR